MWSGRSYDLGRMSFRELAVAYSTYYAIDVYALLAVIGGTVAWYLGKSWVEPAESVAAVILLYPLAWYLIHRFILHSRWMYKFAWTAATWKRIHFDHHQDPHRLDVLFGALWTTLPTIALVTAPVGWVLGGIAGAAAALCVGLLLTCGYELGHCVQHLNYTPRYALLRRIKRLHLAHHFHNERGNYGIVSFLPDRIFGTYYDDARGAPKSATVFNLGYDRAAAARYPHVAALTGAPPRDRPPPADDTEDRAPRRRAGQ
jgi:sterol desaturase/sphingolipid hydroxylase (fatty acid hydroxylase superfamily)